MPTTSSSLYSQAIASGGLWIYLWIFIVSIWAGLINVYRHHKTGTMPHHTTFFAWIGECATSAFAGIVVFLLCRSAEMNDYLSAAFTGIAAHMGTRAFPLMEDAMTGWLSRIVGKEK